MPPYRDDPEGYLRKVYLKLEKPLPYGLEVEDVYILYTISHCRIFEPPTNLLSTSFTKSIISLIRAGYIKQIENNLYFATTIEGRLFLRMIISDRNEIRDRMLGHDF